MNKNVILLSFLSLSIAACSYTPSCDDEDVVALLKKIYRQNDLQFVALNNTTELNADDSKNIRMCNASLVYKDKDNTKSIDIINYEIKLNELDSFNNELVVEIF